MALFWAHGISYILLSIFSNLDFQSGWFGGDWARIVGECACPRGMVFDEREMQCQTAMFGSIGAIIGVVFVGILVLLCACGCCFFAARKFL